MDNKNVEIFCSVVYKEFMAKSLDGNVDFQEIQKHVQALLTLANGLGTKTSVPFHSAPAGSPRGTKVVGDTCGACGQGKIVNNPKTGKIFCDKKCWLNK